jgi:hypothetical protein
MAARARPRQHAQPQHQRNQPHMYRSHKPGKPFTPHPGTPAARPDRPGWTRVNLPRGHLSGTWIGRRPRTGLASARSASRHCRRQPTFPRCAAGTADALEGMARIGGLEESRAATPSVNTIRLIWRDDGTSVVVGRKRAYPVDLARCRVRLQVAGRSWVSKAGSGPRVSRQSSRVVSAVEADSPGVAAAAFRKMPGQAGSLLPASARPLVPSVACATTVPGSAPGPDSPSASRTWRESVLPKPARSCRIRPSSGTGPHATGPGPWRPG